MKRITTVRGDISPSELGFTTMHEHTLCDLSFLSAPLKKILPPLPPEKLTLKNADNPIHEIELKTLRACAKVAAKTGMSLQVHTAAPLNSEHILQGVDIAVNECGMKPDRLLMMHLDSFLRTPAKISDYYLNIESVRGVNTDLQTKVLEKGVNIGFDSWGILVNTLPDDYDRLKGLVHLLKKGNASQIVLGHDVYDKSRGVSYGYTGFTGFAGFALPLLKQLGFGEDVINKLTVENPARILAY